MNNFIGELHKIFDLINQDKFNGELIEPVITVQREKSKKKDSITLGWCSKLPRWVKTDKKNTTNHHEINMVLEYIDRPIEELLATFVHEVVHLVNAQSNIDDCNRKQYHNDEFRKMAEKLGLVVEKTDKGWNQTQLSDELWALFQELNENGYISFDKLTLSKVVDVEKERKPVVRKPIYKYKCPNCGTEVKSTIEDLQARCLSCESDFEKLEK